MAGEQQPPTLVKLPRQLSADTKDGLVSAEQKTLIKQQLLSGGAFAVVASGSSSAGSAGQSQAKTPQPTSSVHEAQEPPLVPLLRQLSACAREGLVDTSQKLAIKVRARRFAVCDCNCFVVAGY
jgi:hypothetical protein